MIQISVAGRNQKGFVEAESEEAAFKAIYGIIDKIRSGEILSIERPYPFTEDIILNVDNFSNDHSLLETSLEDTILR